MLKELVVAFAIVAVCLMLHVFSIVLMAEWLVEHRAKRGRTLRTSGFVVLLTASFSVIIILHMVEIAIWAIFYFMRSLFADFETSLYFSTTSYTTIGYGDVVLPPAWRMLGGIEGVSGVLLCGLSTAFVFAIVNAMFQMRIQRRTNG
jgi:hypothetical protein